MNRHKDQKIIYKDGALISAENFGVAVDSQTLHYGFGAFEGIRSYQTANGTKLFKAKQHFERLKNSCQQIHLAFPWDVTELIADTYKLLAANQLQHAYIRPIVIAEQNMTMVNSESSHIIMMAWEWDAYYGDDLLKTTISSFESNNPKSTPVEAKITGNYLNAVLAVSDAKRKGFDEAILTDIYGYLTEATSANLFIEKDGKLFTPKKGNIVAGITRATVMQIAKQLDIEVIEKDLRPSELKNADAAFLCGTAVEIIGIGSVDDKQFSTPFAETLGASIQRVYKNLVLDKLSFEVII